ncbi:hypothetical protein TWF694_005831 [Orbilia ellipsospora]|uniref:Tetrapyrrole biosynthesis uroporphyrinogen III synthase domain-containing protein n=1 Tax=Orbilia ellipsospora TaxID=2528407 RepID=A0AAV9WT60_9PEZI
MHTEVPPPASTSTSKPSRNIIPVLLLKTKSSPTDPYDTLFSSTGEYDPIFIPVLQHHPVNDDIVRSYILDGAISSTPRNDSSSSSSEGSKFGGLIITSQRAVEALGTLLDELKQSHETLISTFLSTTIIYVVGPATRKALANLGFSLDNILGSDSGNGLALADFIISEYNSDKDLLFLTGETHSTTIPSRIPEKLKELKNIEMKVEEVVVYKTGVMEEFEDEFRGWLDKLDQTPAAQTTNQPSRDEGTQNEGEEEGKEERWIVVFSPTGTEAALKVLNEREGGKVEYKICTIGPTTKDFLWQAFKRKPDAMAKTPSPEGLLEAVKYGSRMSFEVVL